MPQVSPCTPAVGFWGPIAKQGVCVCVCFPWPMVLTPSPIHPPSFSQRRLLHLVLMSANPEASTEDCFVVEYCLGLWLGCVLHNDALMADLLTLPFLDALTLKVIFCAGVESAPIRKDFAHAIYRICGGDRVVVPHVNAVRQHFVDLFLRQLSSDEHGGLTR